jgi:hypothetical protein
LIYIVKEHIRGNNGIYHQNIAWVSCKLSLQSVLGSWDFVEMLEMAVRCHGNDLDGAWESDNNKKEQNHGCRQNLL